MKNQSEIVDLWSARYEEIIPNTLDVREVEIRFLAKDFSEAASIAIKNRINDQVITLVFKISNITQGISEYRISKFGSR